MVAPTDHGSWTRYVPATFPADAPPNAMFCKRDSDGVDWYDYVKAGTNFDATSVKFTVFFNTRQNATMIRAPAVDPIRLFPDNHQVVEVMGDYSSYTTDQLISMFINKLIDLTTGDITDPVLPPPGAPTPAKFNVQDRLAELERKVQALGGA